MRTLRPYLIPLLAIAGIAVSAYLLTVHWGWWTAVCLGVGDCQLVNTSRFSEFLGLPVALLGIVAYAGILVLSIPRVTGITNDWLARLVFLGAVGGVAFSIYLTIIEIFVLREICPWCVLSAILILAIALLSGQALLTTNDQPLTSYRQSQNENAA